jgi:hypothetical protein
MEQESQVEFHERWVKTAEADVRSAKHKFLIWTVAFVLTAAPFYACQFAPSLHRAKLVQLLVFIPFLISMLYMGIAASNLGTPRSF